MVPGQIKYEVVIVKPVQGFQKRHGLWHLSSFHMAAGCLYRKKASPNVANSFTLHICQAGAVAEKEF
jgi:hypothetical protein